MIRTYAERVAQATSIAGIEWYKFYTIFRSRKGRLTDMWVLKKINPVLTQQCRKQGNRLLGS